MKKLISHLVIVVIIYCFSNQIQAQEGYTYTLVHLGGYDFTIQAVPNASSNNFATSVQSYGFTIILPDGATATITSSLGSAADQNFFDGNEVGMPTIDGYLYTETLGSPISLSAPSTGININMLSFTVGGNPTNGELKILENNDPLATNVTPLKSFMSADMVDDSMAIFASVVDENAAAVSGTSNFSFATLSTPEVTLNQLSIYPNPVADVVTISSPEISLMKAEIFNIGGQLVLTKDSDLNSIKVNHLQSGIYFVKVYTEKAHKTIKIVKQ
ncbi:T9SS type A sorting domain-containing protein [Kordia sp.]|uniref:T9SS type A sorting domain-containing protein n=1 Tax=Kordia sp. TaxID=1965332 RepID=UPI003D28ACB4